MIQTMLTQPVEIVHFADGAVDDFGNPTRSETSRDTYRGRLTQVSSVERIADRDTLVEAWRLYLPPGSMISAGDDVLEGGRRFTVEGSPDVKRTPRRDSHVEVNLRFIAEV